MVQRRKVSVCVDDMYHISGYLLKFAIRVSYWGITIFVRWDLEPLIRIQRKVSSLFLQPQHMSGRMSVLRTY